MAEWFDNDSFWEDMFPKLFAAEHWENAPYEAVDIINLLGLQKGDKLLDLCCGPGRHTLEFARLDIDVTGVDKSGRYLKTAREKADTQGLKVTLIESDMKEYRTEDSFDAVINLYTSFGFYENLSDEIKILKNMHSSLKKGGKMLIDLLGKELLASIYKERDWQEIDGILFLEERTITPNWEKIHNRWIAIKDGKRRDYNFELRLFSGVELKNLLLEAGFSSVELYGDLDDSPYDTNASRLIAIATK